MTPSSRLSGRLVVLGRRNDHELAAEVDAGLDAFVGEFDRTTK